jgi:long-chain acyl-CoA synthetase
MKNIDTVFQRFADWESCSALYWRGKVLTYGDFLGRVEQWVDELSSMGVKSGSVCALYGDYSPGTCSLFFALMKLRAIAVPLTPAVDAESDRLIEIAGVEFLIRFDENDQWQMESSFSYNIKPLIKKFVDLSHPGLVVFTSGSTGAPKGILHDCERVMGKFINKRKGFRTILFLLMDHFGGYNSMLGALAYGGTAICPTKRLPKDVCELIADSQATLLPTTPTFLNLLLGSGVWRDYDLSSISLITYGTEVMNETILKKMKTAFPKATHKQTYGLSELGVLRSQSRDNHTTWVKVGGSGFAVKVVEGLLWIKADSNMVGYLNSPNPFDVDGWMCTQDQVEQDGDYIRFLGRQSEIISVGGQKVFPAEVESVLLEADNVNGASVMGQPNPLLGQTIVASIAVFEEEKHEELSNRLRDFCSSRLARHKIPMRFIISDLKDQQNARFKKIRRIKEKPPSQSGE